jgi:c-di-GMP-binding flagellar brake protein YcgR
MSPEERRKFKRVLFTVEDGIVGVLNPPGNDDSPIEATVMDMSQGGVRLLFKPILQNRIMEGDRLVLSEIRGSGSSQIIVNVDTEVKWITEDELNESIGLGVEFLNVLDDNKQKISDMAEFWFMQKLENN